MWALWMLSICKLTGMPTGNCNDGMGETVMQRIIPLVCHLQREIPLTLPNPFAPQSSSGQGLAGIIHCNSLDDSDWFFESINYQWATLSHKLATVNQFTHQSRSHTLFPRYSRAWEDFPATSLELYTASATSFGYLTAYYHNSVPGGVPNTNVPEVAPLSPLTDFGDEDEQLENGHPPRIDTCKTPFHQRLPSSHLRVLPTDMQIIKTIYCLRAPHNRRIPFPQQSNNQCKRWDKWLDITPHTQEDSLPQASLNKQWVYLLIFPKTNNQQAPGK